MFYVYGNLCIARYMLLLYGPVFVCYKTVFYMKTVEQIELVFSTEDTFGLFLLYMLYYEGTHTPVI